MSVRALPTGTLTFLFTDLEGSTRLLHQLGDGYGPLLETHRRLIRESVAAHGGIEFGTGGDALFVVFESAAAAVTAAGDAQRALADHDGPVADLRVRMAIHTGEAQVFDDDYVGFALHVVARLCAAGHGRQVLVSGATRASVRDADLQPLGRHRLRDVPEPIEVFQLTGAGLEEVFPPLRHVVDPPTNLPATAVRLIGRDGDVVAVGESLDAHRLVTLTGPGGSGKTQLALAAAASVRERFGDGVWFVDLVPAANGDRLAALAGQALRVPEKLGVGPLPALLDHLASQEVLVVVDNCEHVIEAVAELVDEVLAHCPGVSVLATSREPLGLRGEQSSPVHALPVGGGGGGAAVELFLERAGEAVPGFAPSAAEVAVVAEICRQLDGLPLAIELAAARLRSISVVQIRDRLGDRFRLLTGGARTTHDRQRTLAAVVGWSYDLLDDDEQWVFRRMSCFVGGFPLDAVEHVAAARGVDGLDIVGRLVDKSLLVTSSSGDLYRYRMLETIRQYAHTRLAALGEQDEAGAAVLEWTLTRAADLERDMRTARQDGAIVAVLAERANANAAIEWAVGHGRTLDALRIVSSIPVHPTGERRPLLIGLLDAAPDLPPAMRAQVLLTLANLAMVQGDWDASEANADEAARLFDALGDVRHRAWARYFEVFALWGRPEANERAGALAVECIATFRDLEDDFGLAYALWIASQFEPDRATAAASAEESVRLFRELEADFGLADALEGRALVALRRGELDGVGEGLLEALSIFEIADNLGCAAHCVEAMAAWRAAQDGFEPAAALLGAAQALRTEVGEDRRAWEREGHRRTEAALAAASDQSSLASARERGRLVGARGGFELARSLCGPPV